MQKAGTKEEAEKQRKDYARTTGNKKAYIELVDVKPATAVKPEDTFASLVKQHARNGDLGYRAMYSQLVKPFNKKDLKVLEQKIWGNSDGIQDPAGLIKKLTAII